MLLTGCNCFILEYRIYHLTSVANQCNIFNIFCYYIQAIPRTIWLDSYSKQLLQWPVEEVESLRGNEISHQGLELKKGDVFEIKGTDTLQVVPFTQTCLLWSYKERTNLTKFHASKSCWIFSLLIVIIYINCTYLATKRLAYIRCSVYFQSNCS